MIDCALNEFRLRRNWRRGPNRSQTGQAVRGGEREGRAVSAVSARQRKQAVSESAIAPAAGRTGGRGADRAGGRPPGTDVGEARFGYPSVDGAEFSFTPTANGRAWAVIAPVYATTYFANVTWARICQFRFLEEEIG